MIYGYFGTPGAGKSYAVMVRIIDALKQGRRVYARLDGLNEDKHREYIRHMCDFSDYELSEKLIYLSDREGDTNFVGNFYDVVKRGSMVVLDEVDKWFSAREWKEGANKKAAHWCSDHRHMGCDLIYMTHTADKVDKGIRSLTEWAFWHRKANYFGRLFQGNYKVATYDRPDCNGKALSVRHFRYKSEYFKCYKSYFADKTNEQIVMTPFNAFKHPIFYILPVLLLFCLYMFAKSSFSKGKFVDDSKVVAVNNKKKTVFRYSEIVNMRARDKFKLSGMRPVGVAQGADRVVSAPVAISKPVQCEVIARNEVDSDLLTVERCGSLRIFKRNGIEYKIVDSVNSKSTAALPASAGGGSALKPDALYVGSDPGDASEGVSGAL